MGKEKRIVGRLTEVFNGTPEREVQLKDVKWILFSDQHKGSGDGADDFKACKPAYHAALGYYFEGGYTLGLLGDVEDLWENRFKPVLKEYADTFQLERRFAEDHPYMRLFGNHDERWDSRSHVDRFLSPFILDHPVEEGIRLKFIWNGRELKRRVFLVHGHQGTFESERLRKLSRFFVRNFWRPIQRVFKIRSTTPATDFEIAGNTRKPCTSSPEPTM